MGKEKEKELSLKAIVAAKDEVYVVVHRIIEDGKVFEPGDVYDGEFRDRFLSGGQVRPVE